MKLLSQQAQSAEVLIYNVRWTTNNQTQSSDDNHYDTKNNLLQPEM